MDTLRDTTMRNAFTYAHDVRRGTYACMYGHEVYICTYVYAYIYLQTSMYWVLRRMFARLEVRSIRWRFSHLLAKWSVHPSASFCSYTNLNYVERARGAGEREACAEHEEARQKEKRREKTEAACLLFFSAFLLTHLVAARWHVGAKDAQDLKRYEKEHGVLGVNLGSGLSAGGGLTLHQELIMTMPGTGTYKLALVSAAKRFIFFPSTIIRETRFKGND